MLFIGAGEKHFGMYSVGEAVSINCAPTSEMASLVLWLNSTGELISFGLRSATLTIGHMTDKHHGLEYTCRIVSGSIRDLNYTLTILSEFSESLYHYRGKLFDYVHCN